MVLASLNQCRGKTNSHDGTKLQLHDCTYMMHIHVVHVSDPRDISKLNQRTFPIVTYSNLLTLPEYLHVNTLANYYLSYILYLHVHVHVSE